MKRRANRSLFPFIPLANDKLTSVPFLFYSILLHKGRKIYRLGLAKRNLWGFGAESWFVVARYAFAKMIPPIGEGAFWQKHNLLKVS